jgi:hypothetical protein
MKNETPRQLVRTPEIRSLFAGDPFIEPAQEINDLIAHRAYELFESSGFTHGHAHEDWLRAEAEILRHAPVDVTETETGFTIRADVPGFGENGSGNTSCPSFPVHHRQAARVIRSKGRNDHLFRTALQTHLPSGGPAV